MTTSRKTILALALAAFGAAGAWGAPLNPVQKLNLKLLELLRNYETYSKLNDDDARDNFPYLFASDSTVIYNDLLGLSADPELTVERYVEASKGGILSMDVELKNIRKSNFRRDGDRLLMDVTFDKQVQLINPCGLILDGYYGKDYPYRGTVVYDPETEEVVFGSLGVDDRSYRPHPGTDITYVQGDSAQLTQVRADGEPLRFARNQAIVRRGADFVCYDEDANMRVNRVGDDRCYHYEISFHPRRWRVMPHYDLSLGNPFSVDYRGASLGTSMSATDFGVDLAYMFPSKSRFKVGVALGLGYSTGKVDLSLDNMSYSYDAPADADIDGDTYVRHYTVNGLWQSATLNYLTVPLYVDMEFRVVRRVALFLDLGVKAYINAGSKISGTEGEATSYGVYPQYDNLVIDDPNMNEFGAVSLSTAANGENPFQSFTADVFANFGIRVKIAGPLSAQVAVGYSMGLMKNVKGESELGLTTGQTSAFTAPVTYTVAGGTAVRDLTAYTNGIKRQGLKLSVGLIYSF